MAKSEDYPTRWCFEISPFKILEINNPNPTPELIRKAYHSQIQAIHADQVKVQDKRAITVTAYNFLEHRTTLELEQLFSQFSLSEQPPKDEQQDLSAPFVNKTKSDRYRRLFENKVNFAKKTRIIDNFHDFYSRVFEKVYTPPPVNCGVQCEICEQEFIQKSHHDNMVFEPYQEYVLENGKNGFWQYLETLYGPFQVYWEPPKDDIGDWNVEIGGKYFQEWCDWLPLYEKQWKENRSIRHLTKAHEGKITLALKALFSTSIPCPVKLSQNVGMLAINQPCDKLLSIDFILPAFLKVFKNVTDPQSWSELSIKIMPITARLPLLFEFCSILTNPSKEDRFYELGLRLAKYTSEISYAHLCFLLGSCDLEFVAEKLATLEGKDVGVYRLAAHYFIKCKAVSKLERLAQNSLLIPWKVHNPAVGYHLALFSHYLLDKDEVDKALRCLTPILKDKLWKFLCRFANDLPHLAFTRQSVIVAETAARTILVELAISKKGDMYYDIGDIVGNPTRKVSRLQALAGALHIVHKTDYYAEILLKIKSTIYENLETWLTNGLLSSLLDIARIPSITVLLQEILQSKQMLGSHAKNPDMASLYDVHLLGLRGVYFFKIGELKSMLEDLFTCSMFAVSFSAVSKITDFLAQNPMLQKNIIQMGVEQWDKLKNEYLKNYTGQSPDYIQFKQVLHPIIWQTEPVLSTRLNLESDRTSPDINALEQDILRTAGKGKQHNSLDESARQAEIGYRYVELETTCQSSKSMLSCVTSAAYHFFCAVKTVPENAVHLKYAYRALVLECCEDLRSLAMASGVLLEPDVLFALRCSLSFTFHTNQHFSQVLQKQDQHMGALNSVFFVNHDMEAEVVLWQRSLNATNICLLSAPQIYNVTEGTRASLYVLWFHRHWVQAKLRKAQYSKNTPEHIFHHFYFLLTWNSVLASEDTGYEPPIPNLIGLAGVINACSKPPVIAPDQLNSFMIQLEKLRHRQRCTARLKDDLKKIPLIERQGFLACRQNSMVSLANYYGHSLADLEVMMHWPVLRRTANGYLDVSDRSLNFSGAVAYSRFLGIQIDKTSQKLHFLMEPAIPGDPKKPALFTKADLYEIFGGKIISAFLSFEKQVYLPNVENHLNVPLAFNPFFKVQYWGRTLEGQSKDSICGTNFHMTLYHLDLLLKKLTIGQEVAANFPFPLQNTKHNLLRGLSKELQSTLKHVGTRRKVNQMKWLENCQGFYISVGNVEENMEEDDHTFSILFGNSSFMLETAIKNEDDDIRRAETEFVSDFNAHIGLIQQEFPIIQRVKELAKISVCFSLLYSNQRNFAEICPDVKMVLNLKPPRSRPYSKCENHKSCTCCDWAPAIYNQVWVTEQQKMEYMFKESAKKDVKEETLKMTETRRRSRSHSRPEPGHSASALAEKKRASNTTQKKPPNLDCAKYDGLEMYRVYGGINFSPKPFDVSEQMLLSTGRHKLDWHDLIADEVTLPDLSDNVTHSTVSYSIIKMKEYPSIKEAENP